MQHARPADIFLKPFFYVGKTIVGHTFLKPFSYVGKTIIGHTFAKGCMTTGTFLLLNKPCCAALQVFFYALAFEPTGPVVHMIFQIIFAVRNWAILLLMNMVRGNFMPHTEACRVQQRGTWCKVELDKHV